ncbi:MAG: hypothetical protein JXK93_08565 [Sphaerochaetaceae bacterium]|nr:hypothetical protein [Sphaerochaetaceae bacterium]
MKRNVIMVAAIVISIVLTACGSDSTGPGEPGDWMPLAVGNWWNHSLDGYWLTMYGDTVDWSGSFDRSITALLDHQGGFQVYEFRTIMHLVNTTPDTTWESRDTAYVYLRETDEEMQRYQDTVSTDYELVALFPLTLGETWYESPGSTVIYEVTSLDASASVPAGNFSGCAIIRETETDEPSFYTWDTYLQRGVGIVYEVIDDGEGQYAEISLENYQVP